MPIGDCILIRLFNSIGNVFKFNEREYYIQGRRKQPGDGPAKLSTIPRHTKVQAVQKWLDLKNQKKFFFILQLMVQPKPEKPDRFRRPWHILVDLSTSVYRDHEG